VFQLKQEISALSGHIWQCAVGAVWGIATKGFLKPFLLFLIECVFLWKFSRTEQKKWRGISGYFDVFNAKLNFLVQKICNILSYFSPYLPINKNFNSVNSIFFVQTFFIHFRNYNKKVQKLFGN
jgi:hypothetical protein